METARDLVVASRFCAGGGIGAVQPRAQGAVARVVARRADALPARLRHVTDPMSGFFLVRRDALDLDSLHPHGFKILLEILVRTPGLRVSEVPFEFGERHAGKTKASVARGGPVPRAARPPRGRPAVARFGRFGVVGATGLVGEHAAAGAVRRRRSASTTSRRRSSPPRDRRSGTSADRDVGVLRPRAPAQPRRSACGDVLRHEQRRRCRCGSRCCSCSRRARDPLPGLEPAVAGRAHGAALRDRRPWIWAKAQRREVESVHATTSTASSPSLRGAAARARALPDRRGDSRRPRSGCGSGTSKAVVAERGGDRPTAPAGNGNGHCNGIELNGNGNGHAAAIELNGNGNGHDNGNGERPRERLERARSADGNVNGNGHGPALNGHKRTLRYTEGSAGSASASRSSRSASASRSSPSPLLQRSPHVLYTNVVEPILRWTVREQGLRARARRLLRATATDAFMVTAQTDTGRRPRRLKLLDHYPYSFLSDDLTIVCPDGRVLAIRSRSRSAGTRSTR